MKWRFLVVGKVLWGSLSGPGKSILRSVLFSRVFSLFIWGMGYAFSERIRTLYRCSMVGILSLSRVLQFITVISLQIASSQNCIIND